MNTSLLLGIDFGTGGCKVTALGTDGAFAGEASVEYTTHHAHPGWSEQDPEDWWSALRAALAKLASKGVDLTRVAALSLDGSTHNAVLLDAAWKPVRRTIMWTDQRATAECDALRADGTAERLLATCYQMPAPTWTLPQMMWLKAHEPEALERTEHVLFVKDYVRFLLTGEVATDRIEAQGTLFFDMARGDWAPEFVAMAGLKPSSLPRFLAPTDVAGRVTAEAAAATGLPAGTPVVCGSSDSAVEDYGAGAVEPGDLILKLATAGNVNSMTAEPHPHPKTLTYGHIVPGMWYSVSATNAAALCLRWLRDTFYAPPIPSEGPGGGAPRSLWGIIDAEASTSPVGANGVMFPPYLQGERLDARRLCPGAHGGRGVLAARLLPHAGGNGPPGEAHLPHRRRGALGDLERDRRQRLRPPGRGARAGRRELRRVPSRGRWHWRLPRRQGRRGAMPAHRPHHLARPRRRGRVRPPLRSLPRHSRRAGSRVCPALTQAETIDLGLVTMSPENDGGG